MLHLLAAAGAALAVWCLVPNWSTTRATVVTTATGDAGTPGAHTLATRVRDRARLGFGPGARRRLGVNRARVVQALSALAAELESGRPPSAALISAGGQPSAWPVAAAATRLGEDVASALLRDAKEAPVLRQLSACWQVATATGTGLSAAVTRLAASARTAEDVRVNLEGQLAGPRATARMLALLPLIGLGFGMMMGADPLAWLFGTPPGLACLTAGVGLTVLGTVWTGRIAAAVEKLL